MAKKKQTMPQFIYVQRVELEEDGGFLAVSEDVEGLYDVAEPVFQYQLITAHKQTVGKGFRVVTDTKLEVIE